LRGGDQVPSRRLRNMGCADRRRESHFREGQRRIADAVDARVMLRSEMNSARLTSSNSPTGQLSKFWTVCKVDPCLTSRFRETFSAFRRGATFQNLEPYPCRTVPSPRDLTKDITN